LKRVAILQARTNSSRLPGKVLLPINGIPLVVLAAQRASNTGIEVVVATSSESTDDALTDLLSLHGIKYYRGSLDNTLDRIVSALSEYDDSCLVFRLTADNIFPDGSMLDEMEVDFSMRELDYLCCNGVESGLPYGMSAELTYLKHLRSANKLAITKHDKEHVTPLIRRKYGNSYFEKYKLLNKGHYRCTVDCLDDYLCVQKVFAGINAPVNEPALSLLDKIQISKYQPMQSKPATKLVLGTAQLGLQYGIANQSGIPNLNSSEELIKTAIANGVEAIDTARAYGVSEEVVGNSLKSGWEGRVKIITKLSPLNDCPKEMNADVSAFVDASIYQSCSLLRMQSLDVLMLHRFSHVTDWQGSAWNRLLEHKATGLIKSIGISIQTPDELEQVLNVPEVEFIQMPFNILDWRWDHLIPKILERRKERGLIIHVRSSLLQGLLPSQSLALWNKAQVSDPTLIIEWLKECCIKTNKASVVDLCLSYVKSLAWIDGIVVGMETMPQLIDNIGIICADESNSIELAQALLHRPKLSEATLNPALWS
jgi:spore coat polysaccharide biosynthesis protein SpsF (cytidylyltransferase family)/aryl-alcohol dehydrogenase-like predicted oxidoreductase